MRRKSLPSTVALTALILAACAPSKPAARPRHGNVASTPVGQVYRAAIVIRSGSELTAIDPATGSVLYQGSGVVSPTDPSRLFTAVPHGGETVLSPREVATGASTATTRIRG